MVDAPGPPLFGVPRYEGPRHVASPGPELCGRGGGGLGEAPGFAGVDVEVRVSRVVEAAAVEATITEGVAPEVEREPTLGEHVAELRGVPAVEVLVAGPALPAKECAADVVEGDGGGVAGEGVEVVA